MPLFSRRKLQALLVKNSDGLSIEQKKRLASSLNSADPQECLPAQWELVFLDTFRMIGVTTYEPVFTGTSRPDFLVKLAGPAGPEFVVRFFRSDEDDDDWIEFEFRGKDAALTGIELDV